MLTSRPLNATAEVTRMLLTRTLTLKPDVHLRDRSSPSARRFAKRSAERASACDSTPPRRTLCFAQAARQAKDGDSHAVQCSRRAPAGGVCPLQRPVRRP